MAVGTHHDQVILALVDGREDRLGGVAAQQLACQADVVRNGLDRPPQGCGVAVGQVRRSRDTDAAQLVGVGRHGQQRQSGLLVLGQATRVRDGCVSVRRPVEGDQDVAVAAHRRAAGAWPCLVLSADDDIAC